jgi:transposase
MVGGDWHSSFCIITPGKNADGYWTNDDLIIQLGIVIPLFERYHPGCKLKFKFDNSGNHHKAAPGGLYANDRNLSDGGKPKPQRDSQWVDGDGVIHHQSMMYNGRVKGIVRILQERGKWEYTISLEAARRILSEEPDFQAQREWLREVIEDAGHSIDYYPKFHCELNWIEMIWAYVKAKLRRSCTYSFPDMVKALPTALLDVPLSFHRRVLRHCIRFMSGYQNGLHGPLLDYVMRKYSGHRTIPVFVGAELEALEQEYNSQREDKMTAKLNSCK